MDNNAQQSAQLRLKHTNLVMQDRHLRMPSNARARTKQEPFVIGYLASGDDTAAACCSGLNPCHT
jgi:hypothetical protein